MSTQENIKVVKDAYAAFGRGDIETILGSLTPAVDFILPGPKEIPWSGRFNGVAEATDWFKTLAATEETMENTQKQFLADGDVVVVLGHYKAKVKSTGRLTDFDWVQTFTMQDGKIARWELFYDTALAVPSYSPSARTESGVVSGSTART